MQREPCESPCCDKPFCATHLRPSSTQPPPCRTALPVPRPPALAGISAPSTSLFAVFPDKCSKEGLASRRLRAPRGSSACLSPSVSTPARFLPALTKISSKSDLTGVCHWAVVAPAAPRWCLSPGGVPGSVGVPAKCIKWLFAAVIRSVDPVQ